MLRTTSTASRALRGWHTSLPVHSHAAAPAHSPLLVGVMKQQRRAFASGADSSNNNDTKPPSQLPKKHWSGINTYYMSMRGLGIAARVVTSMPDFFRFYENNVFAKRLNDDARSAMFVLTQFPSATRIDLLEFRDAAEQLVHTVYEHMYASSSQSSTAAAPLSSRSDNSDSDSSVAATADATASSSVDDPISYLNAITSDAVSADILKRKAKAQAAKLSGADKRVVLEQLSINCVEIAAVDYKSAVLSADERAARGYDEDEWLAIEVQYDVTEHLELSAVDGIGITDRKTVNTTFTWTFESNVTQPELVEWQIVDASPFKETSTLLTAAKAADDASANDSDATK